MSRAAAVKAIQSVLQPHARRLRAMLTRATIKAVKDSGRSQTVDLTVLAGEDLTDVQRLQPFGFTAVPPAGSVCLLVSINGSRTHCIVLGADHDSRPRDLADGESRVYNEQGDFIWLKGNGETLLKTRSRVVVDAPECELTGNCKIDGTLHVVGDVTFAAALDVAGDTTLAENLAVGGDADITGDLIADTVSDAVGTLGAVRVAYTGHKHHGVDRGSGTTDGTDTPV